MRGPLLTPDTFTAPDLIVVYRSADGELEARYSPANRTMAYIDADSGYRVGGITTNVPTAARAKEIAAATLR